MPNFAIIENLKVIDAVVAESQDIVSERFKDFLVVEETPSTGSIFIGGDWDPENLIFLPEKPFDSWIFNKESMIWQAPVPFPESGLWIWDEATRSWNPENPE